MEFICGWHTDKGIKKEVNEDSLLYMTANSLKGRVVLAVVCDGMGGLSHGELASATVVEALSKWFQNDFKEKLENQNFKLEDIESSLSRLLKKCNQRIMSYGENRHIHLGTTVTGMIVFQNEYIIFHVGDTRIYRIDLKIEQLTEDQTWINSEIKKGRLTKEQATNDPRKNVLAQCIGATKVVEPVFSYGHIFEEDIFMICSDGFRHVISEDEIYTKLNIETCTSRESITNQLYELIELNKMRNELDNITALAFVCKEVV